MLKYKIPQIVTLTLNLHLTYFSETLHLLHLKQKSPNPVENQSFS